MTRVLVVDDDPPLLRALRITLVAQEFGVEGSTRTACAQKLEPDPVRPRYLRTEARIGYRFDVPPVNDA